MDERYTHEHQYQELKLSGTAADPWMQAECTECGCAVIQQLESRGFHKEDRKLTNEQKGSKK